MSQIVGYTQGTFDLFHVGHLRLLQSSRLMCDRLVVGVNSDDLVRSYKGKNTIICVEERAEILRALRCVDEVIITETLDKIAMHNIIDFQRIFIGDDWKGNPRWVETEAQLKRIGVDLFFFPYTKGISSTDIRSKINARNGSSS